MPAIAWLKYLDDALDFRRDYGGWLFAVDNNGGYWWFDLSHTPSVIMTHHVTAGLSGALI